MPSRTPLEPAAVDAAVAEIPGWERSGDAIAREYRLADFREAVAFIVRVAFEALTPGEQAALLAFLGDL